MKKVLIIGTVGIPASYGGFETLVEYLTKYASNDIEYQVFCSSMHYKEKISEHNNARLIYLPLKANGIQSIFYDILSMIKAIFIRSDVILILGVSGCIFLPILKVCTKAKIITNIDGLEWRRNKWNGFIKKFLKFSEKLAVRFSDIIVTDNKAISNYVNNEYTKDNCVIAYGGDHALSSRNIDSCKSNLKKDTFSYYLSLCRIEPENNVAMILESFKNSSLKIKFMGNWNNSEYGRSLKKQYSAYPNIELLDPIYDVDKLFSLRQECKGYIHGHSAGGTNPSLVEIMHFAKPVFAYDCDFNRYTTENEACFFSSAEELNESLKKFEGQTLVISGDRMKAIADENYTWSHITKLYEQCY